MNCGGKPETKQIKPMTDLTGPFCVKWKERESTWGGSQVMPTRNYKLGIMPLTENRPRSHPFPNSSLICLRVGRMVVDTLACPAVADHGER